MVKLGVLGEALPELTDRPQIYEYFLSNSDTRIDCSLLLKNEMADVRLLRSWSEQMYRRSPKREWEVLQKLANHWLKTPEQFAAIAHLWLEFDFPSRVEEIPVPNLVFGIHRVQQEEKQLATVGGIAAALDIDTQWIASAIQSMEENISKPLVITSFAYMLSRKPKRQFRLILDTDPVEACRMLSQVTEDEAMKGQLRRISSKLRPAHSGLTRLELNWNQKKLLPERAMHQFMQFNPGFQQQTLDLLLEEGLCRPKPHQKLSDIFKNNRQPVNNAWLTDLLAIKILLPKTADSLEAKAYLRRLPLQLTNHL